MSKKSIDYDLVIQMRLEHPEFTLRELGEKFNVSREYIRQILSSANVETRSYNRVVSSLMPLANCAIPDCENRIEKKGMTFCRRCIDGGYWSTFLGSRKRKVPRVTFQCKRCNKDITMRQTLYERQKRQYINTFCSQKCRSLYIWETQSVRNVGGRIVKSPLGKYE